MTTLPPSCADYLEILGPSVTWNPKGLSRPVQRLVYGFVPLHSWFQENENRLIPTEVQAVSRNWDLRNAKQETNHYTTLLDSRVFTFAIGSQQSVLFFAQFLERKFRRCSLCYRGSIQHGGKVKMNPSWPDSSSSYHRLKYSSTCRPCL